MDWKPISLDRLQTLIELAEYEMPPKALALWRRIRIPPAKWKQSPWGDTGGGFWAVAIMGEKVIWYNDIEDGFETSNYAAYGTIDEYGCDQFDLVGVIKGIAWTLDQN